MIHRKFGATDRAATLRERWLGGRGNRPGGLFRGSIRFRLTVWFTAALFAGLALFGIATWVAVSVTVTQSVDQALENRVEALAGFLEYAAKAEAPEELSEELKEFAMGAPEGTLLRIRDSQGHELLPATPGIPARPATAGDRVYDEITLRGRPYRTLFAVLNVRGKRYEAFAGANLDQRVFILHRFGIALLLAVPTVLLIAAFGGYWLSRRALHPVDEMTEAARSIGIDNLSSSRLSVPHTGDELERLAGTWNGMLDRLEHSVKRLSQFTADASHELRSPIAFIRTAAEVSLRQERAPEAYRETLRQIREESERTSQLIEDLLVLARADAGAVDLQFAPVDLSGVVDEVCRQESRRAQAKSLDLKVRVPGGSVVIEGNDPAIRRLLRVLLENAIKYTPAGGRIEVSLDQRLERIELAVQDSGIGISEPDLPKVFDRFYRADKARSRDEGGCGLGLSIAQWIARCHRAEIYAESGAGGGAVFRIEFGIR
jgi:two-component system heavy metal sensor histidine kinase CusS